MPRQAAARSWKSTDRHTPESKPDSNGRKKREIGPTIGFNDKYYYYWAKCHHWLVFSGRLRLCKTPGSSLTTLLNELSSSYVRRYHT